MPSLLPIFLVVSSAVKFLLYIFVSSSFFTVEFIPFSTPTSRKSRIASSFLLMKNILLSLIFRLIALSLNIAASIMFKRIHIFSVWTRPNRRCPSEPKVFRLTSSFIIKPWTLLSLWLFSFLSFLLVRISS